MKASNLFDVQKFISGSIYPFTMLILISVYMINIELITINNHILFLLNRLLKSYLLSLSFVFTLFNMLYEKINILDFVFVREKYRETKTFFFI